MPVANSNVVQPDTDNLATSDLARSFAKAEIEPHAAQWYCDAVFPSAAIRKMAEIGLLGMTAPARFGGSDASAASLAIAVEEIARADASCALVLSMANSLSILSLMSYGTREQQDEWLPRIVSGECIACFTLTEPQVGSNAAAIKTAALRQRDRYILQGNKQFISLGSVASLAFVFALTDPDASAKGISCFRADPSERLSRWCARRASSAFALPIPARSPSTMLKWPRARCLASPARAIA